jgi:biopolymer transport protein ExbD
MNLRGNRVRDDPEINFIPLIDVLLVILIFLMVTTTYQRIAELQITLPEANADPAKQRPREINIGIDPQGRYKIDREPCPVCGCLVFLRVGVVDGVVFWVLFFVSWCVVVFFFWVLGGCVVGFVA